MDEKKLRVLQRCSRRLAPGLSELCIYVFECQKTLGNNIIIIEVKRKDERDDVWEGKKGLALPCLATWHFGHVFKWTSSAKDMWSKAGNDHKLTAVVNFEWQMTMRWPAKDREVIDSVFMDWW
jgi:hypothetical protein